MSKTPTVPGNDLKEIKSEFSKIKDSILNNKEKSNTTSPILNGKEKSNTTNLSHEKKDTSKVKNGVQTPSPPSNQSQNLTSNPSQKDEISSYIDEIAPMTEDLVARELNGSFLVETAPFSVDNTENSHDFTARSEQLGHFDVDKSRVIHNFVEKLKTDFEKFRGKPQLQERTVKIILSQLCRLKKENLLFEVLKESEMSLVGNVFKIKAKNQSDLDTLQRKESFFENVPKIVNFTFEKRSENEKKDFSREIEILKNLFGASFEFKESESKDYENIK